MSKELQQAEANLDSAIEAARENIQSQKEAPVQEEQEAAPAENKPQEKPKFVEIKDPEVQSRFNYLYRKMSDAEESSTALKQHNAMLEKALEDYNSRLSSFETEQTQAKSVKAATELQTRIKEAYEIGDAAKAAELTATLAKIQAEETVNAFFKKQPKEEVRKPQTQSDFNPNDVEYVNYLAGERDNTGNLKRPYLQGWHPDNVKAAAEAGRIATEYREKGQVVPLNVIMEDLHGRMSKTLEQAVMSGKDQARRGVNEVNLTVEQKRIASKLGISEDRYKKQLQLSGNVFSMDNWKK